MTEPVKTLDVTPELTKAIQDSLNPADIRTVVQAELEKQTTAAAVADAAVELAAKGATAAAAAATTEEFKRTETIGGREFTFEAESELELERAINNAYKVAYAVQEHTPVAEVVDTAAAQAAAAQAEADAITAKAELELKFKRGEISAADFIEQSGAMAEYLEKQGVPINELRESVEQNRSRNFEQSWEQATDAFLHTSAGADWPGGNKNLEIIGLKLQQLGLVEAEDKVAALAQAYAAMKQTGTIFAYESPATTAAAAPAVAASVAAAVPAAAAAPAATAPPAAPARTAATSSSLFGQSSGTGAATAAATPGKTFDVPKEASPQEILAAWKEQQLAAGKDPNAAFIETFAAHRA